MHSAEDTTKVFALGLYMQVVARKMFKGRGHDVENKTSRTSVTS